MIFYVPYTVAIKRLISKCRCKNMNLGQISETIGVGNGYPLQYSCLENSMDRGIWQATVCGVAKGQTQLSTNMQIQKLHVYI